MELPHIESLRGGATAAIIAADLDLKTALAQETARRWFARTLSMRSPRDPALPSRPGRPEKPELIPPKHMKKRSLHTLKGGFSGLRKLLRTRSLNVAAGSFFSRAQRKRNHLAPTAT